MAPTTEAYEVSETGLISASDQFTGADGNGPYYRIGPDYGGSCIAAIAGSEICFKIAQENERVKMAQTIQQQAQMK